MKYFLSILITLMFFGTIFHQPPANAHASDLGQHRINDKADGTQFNRMKSINPGVQGNEFSDDDFDFMENEIEEKIITIADPFSSWNRAMFQLNDRFYFWVLKPISKGYKATVPPAIRTGIKNFFYHIRTPVRLVNCILQGKGHSAMAEYSRFIINSTAGGLGFGNPAKRYPHLNPGNEDLGQTLGKYGIGNGFYLVLPFLGPSSLRDTIGTAGDRLFLDPIAYVQTTGTYFGLITLETVNNTSLRIGDYESLKDAAIQPYEAFRDAYIQYRSNLITE